MEEIINSKANGLTNTIRIYKDNFYSKIEKYLNDNNAYICIGSFEKPKSEFGIGKDNKIEKNVYRRLHLILEKRIKNYFYILPPQIILDKLVVNYIYLTNNKNENSLSNEFFSLEEYFIYNPKKANRIMINMLLYTQYFNAYNKIYDENNNVREDFLFRFDISRNKEGEEFLHTYKLNYKLSQNDNINEEYFDILFDFIYRVFPIEKNKNISEDKESFKGIVGVKINVKNVDARNFNKSYFHHFSTEEQRQKNNSERLEKSLLFFYHSLFQTLHQIFHEYDIKYERIEFDANSKTEINKFGQFNNFFSNLNTLCIVNNTDYDFDEEEKDIIKQTITNILNSKTNKEHIKQTNHSDNKQLSLSLFQDNQEDDIVFFRDGSSIKDEVDLPLEDGFNYLFISDSNMIELRDPSTNEIKRFNIDFKSFEIIFSKIRNYKYEPVDLYTKIKYDSLLYKKNCKYTLQNFILNKRGKNAFDNLISKNMEDTNKTTKTIKEIFIKQKILNKEIILNNIDIEDTEFDVIYCLGSKNKKNKNPRIFKKELFIVRYELKNKKITIKDFEFKNFNDLTEYLLEINPTLNKNDRFKITKDSIYFVDRNTKDFIYLSKVFDKKRIVGKKEIKDYNIHQLLRNDRKAKDEHIVPDFYITSKKTKNTIYIQKDDDNKEIDILIMDSQPTQGKLQKQKAMENILFKEWNNGTKKMFNIYLSGITYDILRLNENSKGSIFKKIATTFLYN